MNGRLREVSTDQFRWWYRNSGRLLELNAKWFGMILVSGLLASCTNVAYERKGEDVKLNISSFANRKVISGLNYSTSTNGTRAFQLRGYSSDQVEAIRMAVEAAVTAAVKSAKP